MLKFKWLFFFFGALGVCGIQAQPARWLTNYELLQQAIQTAIDQRFRAEWFETAKQVMLTRLAPQDSNNWFLEQQLIGKIKAHGIDSIEFRPNFEPGARPATPGLWIQYRLLHLKIQYQGRNSWSFRPARTITRQAQIYFYYQIWRLPELQLVDSGEAKQQIDDEVAPHQLQILEVPKAGFNQAPWPVTSIYSKLIEPVVIIGATGAIVYLFFAYRSR